MSLFPSNMFDVKGDKGKLIRLKNIIKRRIRFIFAPIINGLKKSHKMRQIYAKYYDKNSIEQNVILYESRDGHSITDSPYAIFKYLLSHDSQKKYLHIWSIIDGDEELNKVTEEYTDLPNVRFVVRNSRNYLKWLTKAEFLINNSTFQSFFVPKIGQKYINTWHGTPLKTMGFDIPGNPANSQNVVRNFLAARYLLSPNPHTTRMYTKSYKLEGVYSGEILESGYPRIDLTLRSSRERVIDKLRKLNVTIDPGKKIFLYTPTWKGTNVNRAHGNILQIIAERNFLEKEIGDQYNVLIKVHPFLYSQVRGNQALLGKLVPDVADTNELLSIVDLLVTDYSSIFFDYLVTDNPIIFYCWDKDLYDKDRGMYIKADELPGPTVNNVWQLVDKVRKINDVKKQYKNQYERMKENYAGYDDGHATQRYIDYLFNQKRSEKLHIINVKNEKKKILVYPGGMKNNGITSSFINLTNNIDYSKYDVTIFMNTPHRTEVLNNLKKVNPNVRMMFKLGIPNYKLNEIYRDKLIQNRSLKNYLKIFYPKKAYQREINRLLANQSFDISIDFSGYSYFWAKYIIEAHSARKICFMHNDVKADSMRTIGKRHPHFINLRGIFSVYNKFDKLLSVSRTTMEINKKNLIQYADGNKFDYTVNTIDPEKILCFPKNEEILIKNNLVIKPVKKNAQFLEDISEISVWPDVTNFQTEKPVIHQIPMRASLFVIAEAIQNEEVLLCKILINSIYVGWINKKYITYVEDNIFQKKKLYSFGSIRWPGHNYLWTKPYKIKDCERISNVKFLKNVIVRIEEMVVTSTSTYYLITINGKKLGWLDSNAIKVIGEVNSVSTRLGRNVREFFNHIKHHKVIATLPDRTLQELRLSIYGKIIDPNGQFTVWSKPKPNPGYSAICQAIELSGRIVKIRRKCTTRTGIYYLFEIDGKTLGWLNTEAIDILDESKLKNISLEEKKVHYSVKLNCLIQDRIFEKPYRFTDNKIVCFVNENAEFLVKREIVTIDGTSLELYTKDGLNKVGYIDERAATMSQNELKDINGDYIGEIDSGMFNLITMGRLSPEKNQKVFIEAVAKLSEEYDNVRLYILGNGPLKSELLSLITELGLDNKVFLLGQVDQPFRIMQKCDCFVLSSLYEGQPMVLLEAMTLGMKIVATNIAANAYVLKNGKYGLLTKGTDVNSIYDAIKYMYTHPSLTFARFDYEKYNKQAIQEFYQKINK